MATFFGGSQYHGRRKACQDLARDAPVTTPLVSVLLPVYNGATTIEEALDSLASQSLEDFEIVVVDDGSTDDTASLLAGRNDARLRVVRRPHAGLLPALNEGLKACRGCYVARMDADDRCHPTRLEKQVALAAENDRIGVVGTLVRSFPAQDVAEGFRIYEQWQNQLIKHEQIVREIFIESPIAHPSAMMRRQELVEMGGYQERGWPEDYDLWLRYHAAGRHFAKVPEVLLDWREHESRATRTDSRYSVENFLRAKAHYLCSGPLVERGSVVVWGAGKTGRRLSKHLIRGGHRPDLFVDIAQDKIGRTMRNVEIIGVQDLPARWSQLSHPILLAAVGSRGARELIRQQLDQWGWHEGDDFLCVA